MQDEHNVEVGADIPEGTPIGPTPTSFGLGMYLEPTGKKWVVMEFHTAQGKNMFFFDPEVIAQQIAPALLEVVGQSALVLPSMGDISHIRQNGG